MFFRNRDIDFETATALQRFSNSTPLSRKPNEQCPEGKSHCT